MQQHAVGAADGAPPFLRVASPTSADEDACTDAAARGAPLGHVLDWAVAAPGDTLAEGVDARSRQGRTVGVGFEQLGELVPAPVARGHAAPGGHPP